LRRHAEKSCGGARLYAYLSLFILRRHLLAMSRVAGLMLRRRPPRRAAAWHMRRAFRQRASAF